METKNKNKQTIEQKAGNTILQKPVDITIGGHTYKVAPPSMATLIMVSEQVSKIPHFGLDPENLVRESLWIAKDCRPLGDILAILILGAKFIIKDEQSQQRAEKRHFRLFPQRKEAQGDTARERLARTILIDSTPAELYVMFSRLLQTMQLGDFFGLTTFLTEVNLLHRTKVETTEKETETKATASGH